MTMSPPQIAVEDITFSFGENWKAFSRFASAQTIATAQADIDDWLGADTIKGKTIVDVGSGSGIHSLCFHRMGAASVVSIDVDPHSVECTERFRQLSGAPDNWTVRQGSALDDAFLKKLGTFDIVYSWGVLHHTGDMWHALDNVVPLCNPTDSQLWISIYAKGPGYDSALELKKKYNRSSKPRKRLMVLHRLWKRWRNERSRGNRFSDWYWNQRGMNAYHDMIDWLGGLPYEVAAIDEITEFYEAKGFSTARVQEVREGGCHIYLLNRS